MLVYKIYQGRNVNKRTLRHVRRTKTQDSMSAQSSQRLRCRRKKLCILSCPKYAHWRFWCDCRLIWNFLGPTRPTVRYLLLLLICIWAWSFYNRTSIPAGKWRVYNVGSTSMQRHDVASTLMRRCTNVMCLLGWLEQLWEYGNLFKAWVVLRVNYGARSGSK